MGATNAKYKFLANVLPCSSCGGWSISLIEIDSPMVRATKKPTLSGWCAKLSVTYADLTMAIACRIEESIGGDQEYTLQVISSLHIKEGQGITEIINKVKRNTEDN